MPELTLLGQGGLHRRAMALPLVRLFNVLDGVETIVPLETITPLDELAALL